MGTPRPATRPIRLPLSDFPEANALLKEALSLYVFEESAKLTDISGNGADGAITNSTWKGNSLFFDGTNDYVTLTSTDLTGTKQFSVMALVKPSNLAGVGVLWEHGATIKAQMYLNGSEVPALDVANTGNKSVTGNALTVGNWATLGGTVDVNREPDEVDMYQDGIRVGGSGLAGLADAAFENTNMTIGALRNTTLKFTGSVAFFGLWARVLTPEEMRTVDDFAKGLV